MMIKSSKPSLLKSPNAGTLPPRKLSGNTFELSSLIVCGWNLKLRSLINTQLRASGPVRENAGLCRIRGRGAAQALLVQANNGTRIHSFASVRAGPLHTP